MQDRTVAIPFRQNTVSYKVKCFVFLFFTKVFKTKNRKQISFGIDCLYGTYQTLYFSLRVDATKTWEITA